MKTICKACLLAAGILSLSHSAMAQETEINDMTTPLHLLRPEYKVPYGDLTAEQVKTDIDRVFAYIEQHTPTQRWNKSCTRKHWTMPEPCVVP